MIHVAIVDDHPIARRGIEGVLRDVDHVVVGACAESPAELAALLAAGDGLQQRISPDVIILDLYYSGDTPALNVVAELSRSTRVLVMSASGRPRDVLGAIQAGAAGYLTKESPAAMVIAAVEAVASGGFWLSSKLADILQTELAAPRRPAEGAISNSTLSPREEEALSLIARGFTHAQAATRMGVSKATVNTYVERIRAKLQVGNKAELTRAALQRLGGPPIQ